MEYPYLSPSLVAGEFARQLPPLRQWPEIQRFYRATFGRAPTYAISRLTRLTVSVWDHPDRYR